MAEYPRHRPPPPPRTCYYHVLNVDAAASPSTIVRAYRTLALKYHPDKNPDAPPEHFQAIKQAYEVLGDPDKRRLYDAYGPALRPDVGASLAKLAPLFISFSTGFLVSSARAHGWIGSGWRTSLAVEASFLGLVGFHFCRADGPRRSLLGGPSEVPKENEREKVSVSDYLTISTVGLFLGHMTGWATASSVLFLRHFLSTS